MVILNLILKISHYYKIIENIYKINIVFLGITLGSYEVLFIICAFIILVSMNAFILIKEEGAMGVRTFLRQLIFSRRQIL